MPASNGTESLVQQFSQFEAAAPQPKWLQPVRKAGMASFADQGFPTLNDEDWRFTNIAPIASLPFKLAGQAVVNGVETKALKESVFNELVGTRLVFVNGHYSAQLSRTNTLPKGVCVENLAAAI